MKVRELLGQLVKYNMDADIVVSTGDTFDDVADFDLSYGGPDSGDGETMAQTKHVYINPFNKPFNKKEEQCIIYNAKDGDIVYYNTHYDEMSYIIIFESLYRRNEYEPVEGINYYLLYCPEEDWFDQNITMPVAYYDMDRFKPATDEQKQMLFDALKKYGYEWDSETKKIIKYNEG